MSRRTNKRTFTPEQWAKAIGHPIRRGIILALAEGGKLSPVEYASANELTIAGVSHHFHTLVKLGVLRPAGVKPNRGTIQHFYALALSEEQLEQTKVFAEQIQSALRARSIAA